MLFKKQFFALCFLLLCFNFSKAQIEVSNVSVKDFNAFGFGGFLNFSLPVSDVDYVTLEGGFYYFDSKDDEDLALIPVLVGYRYTLNRSGTGLYFEPNVGYSYGASSIEKYDASGSPIWDGNDWASEKVSGPTAGIGFGYLFEPGGRIQFNLGIRYEHTFGNAATNMFSIRLSHAFTFGRRNND